MKSQLIGALLLATFMQIPSLAQARKAEVWLINPDKSALFEPQTPLEFVRAASQTNQDPTIAIDERKTFQTIDGFGYALTGGSAQQIIRMQPAQRAALIQELFDTGSNHLGVSYLRLSIGASDLNDHVFSYDDLPPGQTDAGLTNFSLEPDRHDVIPVLKEILAVNPRINILGSPWSAPVWMKDNGKVKGGSLQPEFYDAYAAYFVKYIQQMKREGIRIDAITPQNEPLNPKNTPSLVMSAVEELDFIKNHLGPAFKAAGLKTKIILYDHNCDVPQYPLTILDDPAAARYVDGSGFHLYGGRIEAMTQVHDAHPDKNLYFTEQMVTGSVDSRPTMNLSPVSRLVIGATRNWSRNVLLWNLAADPNNQPHTDDGGCTSCQGAITVDGNLYFRNVAYYVIAPASKFVRPGSVRIDSTSPAPLANVAFKTHDGGKVLIVYNGGRTQQAFNIIYRDQTAKAELKPGAVATYVWK